MTNNKVESNDVMITIDPYNGEAFKFRNNKVTIFEISKNLSYKNHFFISYLKLKSLNTAIIEIPKSISNDDLANILSIKAYEELSLDTEKDYKISYIEMSGLNAENRFFNVFVIDTETLNGIFQNTIENIKYIDYVGIAPLLYSAMYKKNLIQKSNIDCFINLSKDDAFLAVYQGGEYFTSRSLRYNLTYLKDKFCEQAGERTSDKLFFNMLKQNGISKDDSEDNIFSKDIFYILDDCFSYISDIINSLNRIYDISINNIFIDTDIGNINGLSKFVSQKLELPVSDLNADLAINKNNIYFAQNHNLMSIEGWNYKEEENDDLNFSIFKRPPPFFQRKSGKFITTLAASFLLSLSYPIFNYSYGFFLQKEADKMQEEYNIKHNDELRIKSKLENLNKEKNIVRDKLTEEEQRFDFRKKLLSEIDDKKNNYKMKSIVLYDLSNLLNKEEIKIKRIYSNDKNITIRVQSDSDKKITEFIKSIAKSPNYSVGTKEISFIEKPIKFYESNISVEIK
ncbi:hypothetical protein [Campylobacter pinnipediorum]|uniref:hypothetical protein n=1 Tax=Campylobacter pinnipediorum TaxID=1965231 RepID=UPI00084DFA77|nr:hypothetical protein [Campylobacter pinnipediorum]AQW84497.1 hypothetical protein CPIN17262_0813 [Campylobacter pinnipediorum subsp. pinnipediorum]